MKTLSKYEWWELSDAKVATPQLNMTVATIRARKNDPISGTKESVLLIVSNNNTQYEVMIPIDSWKQITT
ncbi:hypothetical protein EOL73_00260 [Candidatus Saccharibacteria bacterium]|nr:hypothetical protein [Candidatus Saccharibacteria bacterium]